MRSALIGAWVALMVAGCGTQSVYPTASKSPSRPSSRPFGRGRSRPRRPAVAPHVFVLGSSELGRRIVAARVGDPHGPRMLVVGCIHGNECAGLAVTRALLRAQVHADLWIVENLNPDGYARRTRQNARAVDLNANWSSQWRGGGRPGDVYYGGPHPFSERETRIARRLVLRVRPRVTVWFHQHMDLVWAWGPSSGAGRRYARVAGMRYYHRHWLPGTATNWQNHHLAGASAFTVELPAGRLSPAQVRRHVRAVLGVAEAIRGPSSAGRSSLSPGALAGPGSPAP